MRIPSALTANWRRLSMLATPMWLICLSIALALGLALSMSKVSAATDPANTIQVCVNTSSLNLDKVEPPGVDANCTSKEFLLQWLDTNGTDALANRIATLESENQSLQTQLDELKYRYRLASQPVFTPSSCCRQ